MGAAEEVTGVRSLGHLNLQRADEDVAAQGPEMGLLNAVHSFQLHHLPQKADSRDKPL